MSDLVPAIIIVGLATVLFWILRTFSDNNTRRKLAETRAGIHRDLVTRFSSSDELLGYLRSDAGRRLLVASDVETPNPVKRILAAVQTGIIMAAVGIALLGLSQASHYGDDARSGFGFLGTMALAVGLGFLVSAAASWLLSRRLGLIAAGPAADDTAA